MNLSDPNDVHLLLIYMMLPIFFGVFVCNFMYLKALFGFFDELRQKEEDTWRKIGAPTLANSLLLPFWNFHKYYAFLPYLKDRKDEPDYPRAQKAYKCYRRCFVAMGLLFAQVVVIVAWIVINDL